MSNLKHKSSINNFLEANIEDFVHVLHVDDDSGLLEVAKQILEIEGQFKVESELSVDEALERLRREEFDVIVSDYEMPEKNGLEFLKEIRSNTNYVPFILFTGKGREDVVIQALNLGADHYINKIGKPETVYGELSHYIKQCFKRKKAENNLITSKKQNQNLSVKNRIILDSSPDNMFIIDLDLNIIDCNRTTLQFGGFSDKKEIIGKSILGLVIKKDQKRTIEYIKEILEKEKRSSFEITALKKNGDLFLVETTVNVIKNSDGNSVGFVFSVRDISERKKTEEELRKREQEFRILVKNAPDIISRFDKEFCHVYVNPFNKTLSN